MSFFRGLQIAGHRSPNRYASSDPSGRIGSAMLAAARALKFKPVLVTFVTFAAAASLAAESGPLASPEYRLRVADPDSLRLAATGSRQSIATPLADRPFAEIIDRTAREAAVDPALVHAVIYVESRYNPAARSAKGAVGLMQVLPETASRYGVANPASSIEENLRVGTRYLRDLIDLFDNRIELVLAAYNSGENAVMRHGLRIPPYRETRLYVPAVLDKLRELREPPPPPESRIGVIYMPGTRLDPGSLRR